MKYVPLNSFPEHDANPFIEKALEEIVAETVKKKIFLKGNRSVVNHVVNDNGEIVAHSAFLKVVEVDEKQFVKIYVSRFAAFYELTKPAIKVFGYIINECIVKNNDIFYFDYDEARKHTGYQASNHIRTGLACLIENGIIARSTLSYKFFINPMVIFNGNRITFAESYVKKRDNENLNPETDQFPSLP